jgi:hypothetical protein
MKLPNLFDPYEQPENQVTNALLQTLGREPALTKDFVVHLLGCRSKGESGVSIQLRPSEVKTATSRHASIPDGWIVADDLVVAIESKIVSGSVTSSQISRHVSQIPAPGMLLILSPDQDEPAVLREVPRPPGVEIVWRSWRDVHSWTREARRRNKGKVAPLLLENLKEYLEMMEIVGFTGIDLAEGYEYPRAKAILKALVAALAPSVASLYPEMRPSDHRPVKDDRTAGGGSLVWLPFSEADDFTTVPHFTLALFQPFTRIALTLPNGAKPSWRRLSALLKPRNELSRLLQTFLSGVEKTRREYFPATSLHLYQRHWLQRATSPLSDAEMQCNLATFFPSKQGRVRRNRGWWQAGIEILREGPHGANWELQIAVDYSNRDPLVQATAFVNEALRVLRLFRPLYFKVRG